MNIDERKQEVQEVVTSKQGIENSITPEGLGGLLSDMCDFASQMPSSVTFSDIVVENTATVKSLSGQTVVSETISGGSLLSYFISGSTVSGLTIVGNTVDGNRLNLARFTIYIEHR